jgi:hypothetical protein
VVKKAFQLRYLPVSMGSAWSKEFEKTLHLGIGAGAVMSPVPSVSCPALLKSAEGKELPKASLELEIGTEMMKIF